MILIRGASVITMDARVGDMAEADVLIDGERISAIAPAGSPHPPSSARR